jgi:hypothetical protein
MADITDALGKLTLDASKLESTLDKLNAQKQALAKSGDVKSVVQIEKLAAAYRKLTVSMKERIGLEKKISDELKSGKDISEEYRQEYERLNAEVEAEGEAALKVQKIVVATWREKKRLQLEQKELLKDQFLNTTKLGKAYGMLSGPLAKLTAGITLGTMAMKALKQVTDAAALRNKMFINSYKGLDNYTLGEATRQTMKLADAIRETEVTAHRFGVSTDEVTNIMLKFNKITGTKNPEALKTLTQATMAVATAMGIDTAEATDYVSTRMEKFGGTAASAIASLNEMRQETESLNNSFGRTVVKGDDLVKVVSSISRETDIYAVDQRMVGNILRDNISRLTSMGESYDTAFRKAEMFTRATTGKVPEWMQINIGADLLKDMQKAMGTNVVGQDFMAKFGEDLDKAKPGLSKKVRDILGDSSINSYAKSRMIQELTKGTEIGQKITNKAIVDFANKAGGGAAVILAQQLGVGISEAQDMINLGKEQLKTEEELNKMGKMTSAQLADEFNKRYANLIAAGKMKKVTAEDAEAWKGKPDSIKKQNDQYSRQNDLLTDQERIQKQMVESKSKQDAIAKDIAYLEEQKALTKDENTKKALDQQIKDLETKSAQYDMLASSEQKPKEMQMLQSITDDLAKKFLSTSVLTGNFTKELMTSMSSIENLLAAGVTAQLFTSILGGGKLLDLLSGGGGGIGGLAKNLGRGAGGIARGIGAVGSAIGSGGLVSATGATGAAAGLAMAGNVALVGGAGLLGYQAGKPLGRLYEKHLGEKTRSAASNVIQMFGGDGIMSDEEAMRRGEEMQRKKLQERKQLPKQRETTTSQVTTPVNKMQNLISPAAAASIAAQPTTTAPASTTGPAGTAPIAPTTGTQPTLEYMSTVGDAIICKFTGFRDAIAVATAQQKLGTRPS